MPTSGVFDVGDQPTAASPFAAIAKRAALWLVFLAPFFYLSYGFANWAASQRENVGSIVYDWERAVPFHRLDDRPLLDDQRVLRAVAVRQPHDVRASIALPAAI